MTADSSEVLGVKWATPSSGGAVDSVNGETGVVVLTTGDLTEETDKNYVTDAESVVIGNTSNTNTGDQDLSGLATKANVLELDNTDSFTPDADYEPATKKYVDDNGGGSSNTEQGIAYATSITPDLSSGNVIKVGELTGNITVNNPTNPTTAEEVYIRFVQDSSGGRVVTLGTNYILIDNNEDYPTTPDAIFFFSGITQSDGTIEGGFSPLDADADSLIATTSAITETELFANGATGRFTLDDNDAYVCIINLMATQADGSMGSWDHKALISRQGATTTLKAVVSINTDSEDTNIGSPIISITADDTNEALAIKVTPANSIVTKWKASINSVKLNF